MAGASIQVIGIGLDGVAGLSAATLALIEQADLLVGSARHLAYFPSFEGEVWPISSFQTALNQLKQRLASGNPAAIVVLTSGDPLFFGLGRLLLAELPPEQITFHPHVSSVQLAFSRLKLPWQNATLVSAHGRSAETLTAALRRGDETIAVLTDGSHTPNALASLLLELDLPVSYQIWVCENLGGADEQIQQLTPEAAAAKTFAPLNVVVFQRQQATTTADPATLPLLGLPDSALASFADRPGLMTKREVRLLVLGELGLQPGQVIWDVGAGTGSVSVEAARLVPDAKVFAIEKTAIGVSLIEQNRQRFQLPNLLAIEGSAPEATQNLPAPDRVFVGGSGGQLQPILDYCQQRIRPGGRIVLALATLEHLNQVMQWLGQAAGSAEHASGWQARYLQAQLSRSVDIAALTRWQPLNPVTLVTLTRL
ncbi:MAG: precorrin-6y C5,15-methyltransferase (decarboxylating) subunit CbiE [Cyanobacteria bacterium Co-bin13]|nr:precorrin-6y C5,15-methyltransferase (decarboxylating) subunit CbiE [Cyanobacteria bacterium Co-bin13]